MNHPPRPAYWSLAISATVHGAVFLGAGWLWITPSSLPIRAGEEHLIELIPVLSEPVMEPKPITPPVVNEATTFIPSKITTLPTPPKVAVKVEPTPLPKPVSPPKKVAPAVIPFVALSLPSLPTALLPAAPVIQPQIGMFSTTALGSAAPARLDVPHTQASIQGTSNLGSAADANNLARPVYRSNPAPAYPPAARRRKQEGVVWLEVEVSTSGEAVRVKVDKSSGVTLLDEAAEEAVRHWRFEPARLGGMAINSRVQVPIRFQLGN